MDPAENPQTSKCAQMREKFNLYFSYAKLWVPDGVCAFLHILVLLCLRLQWLMIITFVVIRIPRFILYLLVKRLGEASPVWVSREFIVRKYSCILYFPLAVVMQMITMATNFCLPAGNVKACYTAYAITMISLLVIH